MSFTENWPDKGLSKLESAKVTLGKRKGPNVRWLEEREDDSILRIWEHDLRNGIPTLASALNDWECGLACLAGRPNSGKSTVLVNMMIGSLQLNEDLMIVDLSLDDPYNKRYQQYVACMTGLYYQQITTLTDLSEIQLKEKKRAEDLLAKWYSEDRLRTIEPRENFTTDDGILVTRIFRDPEEICRLMRNLRAEYPSRKIAFFIDAWNNIDVSRAKAGSDIDKANYTLNKFQEEANSSNIMLMVSAHLRKDTRMSPSIEDVKGTSDMGYNALWAGLVINEVKENKLNDPLIIVEDDKAYPVIAIEIPKNKVSTVESELFYILKSGQCGLVPLSRALYSNMRNKYYSERSRKEN